MVREIMDRLVQAARVEKPDLVDLFQREVKLLDNDSTVNASCSARRQDGGLHRHPARADRRRWRGHGP
ncbi:MAG: hypothetical protein R3E96_13900 [Planctomycetota bacterium]